MSAADTPLSIKRLKQAITSGQITDPKQLSLAKDCLNRYQSPVRVNVIGSDQFAATHVTNFLAASDLIPLDRGRSVLARLVYSKEPNIKAQNRNGEAESFPVSKLSEVFESRPAHITIGAPLDALKKITLTRYATSTVRVLQQAAELSAEASDVLLWCSRDFGIEEAEIWSELPERARDHGCLILPHGANPTIDRDLFGDVVCVDPEEAIKLRAQPGPLDTKAFKAIGGTDLVAAVKREMEAARRAQIDLADILLMSVRPDARARRRAEFVASRPVSQASPEKPKTMSRIAEMAPTSRTPSTPSPEQKTTSRTPTMSPKPAAKAPKSKPSPKVVSEVPKEAATPAAKVTPKKVKVVKKAEADNPPTPETGGESGKVVGPWALDT